MSHNDDTRRWRLAHPEQDKAAKESWKQSNPNHHATWRKNNRSRIRGYALKRIYGITLKQFDAIFEAQGSCCKICKSTDPKGRHNSWHVNHDHNLEGKNIRGILCQRCNLTLGQLENNNLLQSMSAYLENASHNIQTNRDLCLKEEENGNTK